MTTSYETIKIRRGLSTDWATVNPVPAQGEPCMETDTGKLKLGDGLTHWNTLPYYTVTVNYPITLTGDATIPYESSIMIVTADPGTADRILNPSSDFANGSLIMMENVGTFAVLFDSTGLNRSLGGGNKDWFVKSGGSWK